MEFEQIYNSYWAKIYRLCLGYLGNETAAQDLAQETFITVWQKLPEFRQEASINTWIFRIATNKCLRHIKSDKSKFNTEIPVHLSEEKSSNEEKNLQLLQKFIAELPELDRLIISLELENINQAEIATIVGISESNTRVRIHRIKEKLKTKFENHGK
ncbi:MAG: RNA polymerase sigma factor [Chitinophagales bacterium]|nr:RNA polymerase sigma factor [Chitinophagales bacterium]